MIRLRAVSLLARRCVSLEQNSLPGVSRLAYTRPALVSSTRFRNMQQHASRPTDQIPIGLGVIENMVNTFRHGGFENIYEIQREKFQKYGPIFKESLFGKHVVHIADAEATARIAQAEGKFAVREHIDLDVMEDSAMYDLGGNDFARWRAVRKAVGPTFLRPAEIRKYAAGIDGVACDAVRRLRLRVRNGGALPLREDLHNFAAENILLLMYGERMGIYDDPPNPRVLEFMKLATEFFSEALVLGGGYQLWRYVQTPAYRKFQRHRDRLFNIAGAEFSKIAREKKLDGVAPPCLLDKIPDTAKGGKVKFSSDLAIAITEAGIETTSSTLEWFLYHMSLYPEVQEKAYNEIVSIIGTVSNDRSTENPQYHSKLPYLTACIKESMRLNPVSLLLARTISKDTTVCDYFVPSGSNVFLWVPYQANSPMYFSRPEEFNPQRWIRGEEPETIHPFASLPFGFGVRMCLGRRYAELVLAIAAARILQTFHLKYAGRDLIKRVHRLGNSFTQIEPPIKFIERR